MSTELNGIVVVDKPEEITSAGVVAKVKKLFRARKVGHTGTLDPFATGVLICCINKATKLARFFLKGDKAYEAELVLGVSTETQDATGAVVKERQLTGITARTVIETARRFTGAIEQVPPIYSALKHRGTPLYKLARQGKALEKPARTVKIHALEILEVNLPKVRFFVSCSSGTYIRTVCSDMGDALGCGAHLSKLRRLSGSGFTIDDAIELKTLLGLKDPAALEKVVVPMNKALPFMQTAVADDRVAGKIKNGVKLFPKDLRMFSRLREQEAFKVIDHDGRLVAVLAPSSTTDAYDYCCVF